MKNLLSVLLIGICFFINTNIVAQDSTSIPNINPKDVIEKYLEAYQLIRKTCREIEKNSLIIRAAVKRRKREFRKTLIISILASLIATVIIALGIWLSTFLPKPLSSSHIGDADKKIVAPAK